MGATVFPRPLEKQVTTDGNSIGTLSSLITTAKTDLVSAVNEVKSDATTNSQAIATLNSNKQDKSSLFIKSSSYDATQTFDISNKGFSNPVFMLTIGFATSGLVAIVYLNSMSETNISYQKISGVGNLDISSMSYNANGTITVTFSGNPYRKGCLTVLNW